MSAIVDLVRMQTKLMKWSTFRLRFKKNLIFPICEKSGSEFVKKGKGSVSQIENKVEGLHLLVNLVSPRTSHLRALDSRLSRSNWFLKRGWTIMLR